MTILRRRNFWNSLVAIAGRVALSAFMIGAVAFDSSAEVVFAESQPNDTQATAELITGVGTGPGEDSDLLLVGSLSPADPEDYFSIALRAGDVIGGNLGISGDVSWTVSLLDEAGIVRANSHSVKPRSRYPESSPLPQPEASNEIDLDYTRLARVISVSGVYAIRVTAESEIDPDSEPYEIEVGVFRPGLESAAPGAKQIVFVDFDGTNDGPGDDDDADDLDTAEIIRFGTLGTANAVLSPLSAFLEDWDLDPDATGNADENAIIDRILDVLNENFVTDLQERGLNPAYGIEFLNSRDHPNGPKFGDANVARVIIGGTTGEANFPAIAAAVAQAVDIGNFDTQDTAIILLDELAGRSVDESLGFGWNDHDLVGISLEGGATVHELIGSVIAKAASHELGHLLGNYHTQSEPDPMQAYSGAFSGGKAFENSAGVFLPDTEFGGPDDVDIDFGERLGVHGDQVDTLNAISFALTRPDADRDGHATVEDNCSEAPNGPFGGGDSSGTDTDGDGYGNACDADYDQDGVVAGTDYLMMFQAFGTSDPLFDHDGDGVVGGSDFGFMMGAIGHAPGPSGLSCADPTIVVPADAACLSPLD